MSYSSLRTVLDKMGHEDPDFRYMSTSDLLEYLNKNKLTNVESDIQRRLCKSIIMLLTDSSSEVQGMAQKCLPPLSRYVYDQHAVYLVEKLLDHVVRPEDPARRSAEPVDSSSALKSLRDVAALGLKSIVNDLSPTLPAPGSNNPSQSIATHMLPRLLAAIETADVKTQADLQIEALELLHALLLRLATLLSPRHADIQQVVLPQLGSPSAFVCKRATSCLAVLAPVCEKVIFDSIVSAITTELANPVSREKTRTAVHAFWALSKTAGHRLAENLPALTPILFQFCTNEAYEEDDELREHCLQTLESFVDRCTYEMREYAGSLATLVVSLATYDPNYADEDDEDGMVDDDGITNGGADDELENDDDEYGDDDDDDFSDDDDSSWKVRRAAVKCIHAAISSQLRSPDKLYADFGLLLVNRFKEREETVKLDAFAAFSSLLRQAGAVGVGEQYPLLREDSPRIVRAVKKELGSRSVRTRISAVSLLRELVSISPTTVAPLLHTFIGDIHKSLADPSAQIKTEALLFLHAVLAGCGADALKDHAQIIVPRVLETAEDRYYKITAESLRLCSAFIVAFGSCKVDELKQALAPMTPAIHDAALRRLTAKDQDSEVKEAGLDCVGASVALFGANLGQERLSLVAPILVERLSNEVTRLPTVRALNRIANAEHCSVLDPVIEQMTNTVGSFLRQSNTPLRLASLTLLASARHFSAANDSMLLANVADLVSDSDLRLAALSLHMCAQLTKMRRGAISEVLGKNDGVFPRVLELMVSPLLQGRAVNAIMEFFEALAETNTEPLTVPRMLGSIRVTVMEAAGAMSSSASSSLASSTGALNPIQSGAKCVSKICQGSSSDQWSAAAAKFVEEVGSSISTERAFALACLGELGRRSLFGHANGSGKDAVQAAILSALDAEPEEVKGAAAVALGGLASGDSSAGVSDLIQLVRQRPEHRYLLLLSLRDTIAFSDQADICTFTSNLLQVLLDDAPGSSDMTPQARPPSQGSGGQESILIATAECLGLLAQVNPEIVLPELVDKLGVSSAGLRGALIAAVKFTVSPGPAGLIPSPALPGALRNHIGALLSLAKDGHVSVRKNAMQTVNAVARTQPALLRPHLGSLLPAVYAASVKDESLTQLVDLGPFKFEDDRGLDLRKSSFDCMRTFIGVPVLSPLVLLPAFLERTVAGLSDVPDVRAIAQLVLATVANLPRAPVAVLDFLDKILAALQGTLNERVKENAVRQEQELHEESINAALRTVRSLARVPAVSSHNSFVSFMERTVRTERLGRKYDELLARESGGGPNVAGDAVMRD